MIKRISLLIMIFKFVLITAQTKTNVESIFKMHLFLNKPNANLRIINPSVVKNDSLFDVFADANQLSIDTLKSLIKDWNIDNSNSFKFYRVNLYKIQQKKKLSNEEEQYIGLFSGTYQIYIIALNSKSGMSFRLSGFDTNDFLFFLSEFKEHYWHKTGHKLSTRRFLKYYKIEGIDFNCLYKGLKGRKINRIKCPCLKRCNDPVSIID